MAVSPASLPLLRFGLFELDPARWELRRSGVLLDLQQQPCRLLYLLASQPRQVVRREHIAADLWPEVKSGDLGSRINFCIARIREALDDDAANPRFIQTLRGQGYCFLAPLLDTAPVADPRATPATPNQPAAPSATSPSASPRRAPWLVPALAAAILLAALFFWRHLTSRAPVPPALAVTASAVVGPTGGPLVGDLAAVGPWVYFSASTASGQSLFRMPLAGGSPSLIPTGLASPQLLAASPDGHSLVLQNKIVGFAANTQAFLLPSSGATAQPFGAVRAPYVAWRPDGTSVAYSAGSTVWLADARGLHPRQLAHFPADTRALAWSPDGHVLAVETVNQRDDLTSLWTLPATGGTPRLLLPLPMLGDFPQLVWMPHPPALLFQTNRLSTGVKELLSVSLPAPGHKAALAVLSVAANYRPISGLALAPSGRILVGGEAAYGNQVLRWDPASHSFKPFLDDARDVVFSPGHRRIAYVRTSDGTLWVARTDGSQPHQLTQPPFQAMLPRWSPNGTRLAFTGLALSHNWRLYLIDPAVPSSPQPLPDPNPNNGQGAPTWTPNGKSLIYANTNCPLPAACGVHRLNLASGTDILLPASTGLRTARLSPNGRWIAALTTADDAIKLLDTAHPARGWRTLWPHSVGDFIEWSSDSRSLYAASLSANDATVVRLPIPSGLPQTVATYHDANPQDVVPFAWLGLTPTSRPLLAVVSSDFEILSLQIATHKQH